MKKLNVICFLFILPLMGLAQQRPYYTQYILNNFLINPALAGIENYWDVKTSHRIQWQGVQDAPVTTYLTFHGPLKKQGYASSNPTSMSAPGENPRGRAYWQNYQAPEPHHGVGFTVLNDQTGPLNRFAAYGTYAYHRGIAAQTTLSFGVSAGMTNLTLNTSKLNFGNTVIDPAVGASGLINTIKPDISAGLWLYSNDYFVGLSAQQIVPQNVAFSDNKVYLTQGKLVPHIFLSAGYRFQVSEDLSLLPSALIRYISPLPIGIDINAKLMYQDLIWFGGSYRFKEGYAGMVGFNVNNNINIGYSYDFVTSTLNTVSRGTHEILIGFQLGNKYGDWCPKNLW
jgi:type IX secretion system PorP/SprF family membrane protein